MKLIRFIALTVMAALPLVAQQPQPQPAPPPAPPQHDDPNAPIEQTHKNIKVLKGLPTRDLIPMMTFMSNSLGVACTHCHVDKKWEEEGIDAKDVARAMIVMVRDINERHFGGEQAVTCMSCHQGHITPASIPKIADAGWNKKPDVSKPSPTLPTLDAVLAKYVDALGGAKSIAAVKSRVERGTVTKESGREEPSSAPFTMYVEQPGTATFDTELRYPGDANQEIVTSFFRPTKLDQAKANLRVGGIVDVRGHDAVAVEVRQKEGRSDWLYFDAKDGLLLRKRHEVSTPLGVVPSEYDYEDYRLVDDVKVPFKMTFSRGDYRVTHKVDEVKNNAAKPEPAPKKP